MENDRFWQTMDRLSDILQILNYEMLLEDSTNNDLMKYLQHQDLILEEQTEKYLKSINKKLDKLLEERQINES
jgi:hypothetical protein